MNLGFSPEQTLLADSLRKLLAEHHSLAQVREREGEGWDPELWVALCEFGLPLLRIPEAKGGAGLGLTEAILVAEELGAALVQGPWLESIVATQLLANAPGQDQLVAQAISGELLITFAPTQIEPRTSLLVPGGRIASRCVYYDGSALRLATPEQSVPVSTIADEPHARWSPDLESIVIAEGAAGKAMFEAARTEWRLLAAAATIALGRRSLECAAAYAGERSQFGRLIGSFQAIAHPLADAACNIQGGRLLVMDALIALGRGSPDAQRSVDRALAWAAHVVPAAATRAAHTFGGYGLASEGDPQLFFRHARRWSGLAGDWQSLFSATVASENLRTALPEAGDVSISFDYREEVETFRKEVTRFFEEFGDDQRRASSTRSWEDFDPAIQRELAKRRLHLPSWPAELGGRGGDADHEAALFEEYNLQGWAAVAGNVLRYVGSTVLRFGSPELVAEIMPQVKDGSILFSLGYTEPGCGSDVSAVQTQARAIDSNRWSINGQKMFNSGTELASYILLAARTDNEAPRHKGITMFLVPVATPGIEYFPIHILSGERTNATYLTDVEISDRYRLGEVNGGWGVLMYALGQEHADTYAGAQGRMVAGFKRWSNQVGTHGGRPIDDPLVRWRLGLAATRTRISELLYRYSVWCTLQNCGHGAEGPMSKVFSSEGFLLDAQNLLDAGAPGSLLRNYGDPAFGTAVEASACHALASTVYGGSSEILRSVIAERALGLPRSRS